MNRNWIIPVVIAVLAVFLFCCLCLVLFFGTSVMLWNTEVGVSGDFPTPEVIYVTATPPSPTTTPRSTRTPRPTQTLQPGTTAEPAPTEVPLVAKDANETLRILKEEQVPPSNTIDLARRLRGVTGISATLEPPAAPRQVGEQKSFWVLDTDQNENFQVETTLRYVTEHAYFFIENGVDYSAGDLRRLTQTFESQIYPTNREFFGSEWSPGVDGDVHIYIVYARGVGSHIAAYFGAKDMVNPAIDEFSNGHEMFVLNADTAPLNDAYTYGALAHEFQHMIHWYRDHNEETWIGEGLSELATLLNGYEIGGHDLIFAMDPDLQLNDWPNDDGNKSPHYGAAFLYVNYFLNRFGEEATQALVGHEENGLDSVDLVLSEMDITDPLTGETIDADDVFIDWALTNYLQDSRVSDERFTYPNYPGAPQTEETERLDGCAADPQEREVSQYGADYISIRCRGETTLNIEAPTQVNVVPEDAFSGTYAFWSNKGDESDMTLTQTFDFTDQSGPLTLRYWTWFDIETDYDYVYLLASTDGEIWEMLTTPSGTDENPVGSNYGWGYTGLSGGAPEWVLEEVDISQFAGQEVQLRFEYITDLAVNGEGLLLDDIEIPETGYFSDFESDEGGWTAEGFVRIQNALPQTFRLALIKVGRPTTVEYLTLDAENKLQTPLQFGNGVNEMVLVVGGTTRHTRIPATYQFSLTP